MKQSQNMIEYIEGLKQIYRIVSMMFPLEIFDDIEDEEILYCMGDEDED